jgi:hypothetical protein
MKAGDILISYTSCASGQPEGVITVAEALKGIRGGAYRAEVEQIRSLYAKVLKERGEDAAIEAVSPFKKQLPGLMGHGTFKTRGDKNLDRYSGLLWADLDHLGERLPEIKTKLVKDPHACTAFLSPTGTGLKVPFAVGGGPQEHEGNFLAVQKHVRDTYGVEVDTACRNLERLCFYSWDPQLLPWRADAVPLQPLKARGTETASKKAQPPQEQAVDVEGEETDFEARRAIVEELLGEIAWENETVGNCKCPNFKQHTTAHGAKDCRITLDGVPTIYCFHHHCQKGVPGGRPGPLDKLNHELRSAIRRAEQTRRTAPEGLPDWELPKQGINCQAKKLFDAIASAQTSRPKFFLREGALVQTVHSDNDMTELKAVDAERLPSVAELYVQPFTFKGKPARRVYSPLSIGDARVILKAREQMDKLPILRVLANAPVLVADGNKPRIITGYDPATGIYVLGGGVETMPFEEAKEVIQEVFEGFAWTTEADASRAYASLLTPALVLGGLIEGRPAMDVSEADDSQAGKGLRLDLIALAYNEQWRVIAAPSDDFGGGNKQLEDAFDACLIKGAHWVRIDNFRGELRSQKIESFLTESNYTARAAYLPNTPIDPRRRIVAITSNGLAMTQDLCKRCNIVRILKQNDRQFRDIRSLVRCNQPKVLGAIYAFLEEWIRRGRPRTGDMRHDFRPWGQSLDWIVQNLFDLPPLMDGHQKLQKRVTSLDETWARQLALALGHAHKLGGPKTASELAAFCRDHGIGIPHEARNPDERQDARSVGLAMARVFGEKNARLLEGYSITRTDGGRSDVTHRTIWLYNFVRL